MRREGREKETQQTRTEVVLGWEKGLKALQNHGITGWFRLEETFKLLEFPGSPALPGPY